MPTALTPTAAKRAKKRPPRLGVPSLRQATLDQVESGLDGELRRRARHVVTENDRVRDTVDGVAAR